MPRILVEDANGRREFLFDVTFTLGRHPANLLCLGDPLLSRRQAEVSIREGAVWYRDLASFNGSHVEGVRIVGEQHWQFGQTIEVGRTRLTLQVGDGTIGGLADTPAHLAASKAASPMPQLHVGTVVQPGRELTFPPANAQDDRAELGADYDRLRVAYDVQRALAEETAPERICTCVLTRALETLGGDAACAYLRTEEAWNLVATQGTRPASSSTLLDLVAKNRVALLTADAQVDERLRGAESLAGLDVRATMAAPMLAGEELIGVLVVHAHGDTHRYTEKDLRVLLAIAALAAAAIERGRMRERQRHDAEVRARFGRLVSPALAERIASGALQVRVGGSRHEGSVLFSDIRDFTPMGERHTPEEVVSFLNEYFSAMIDVLFLHEGTLDKLIGDAIMAIFGAPVGIDDHAIRAVATAVGMREALNRFNEDRSQRGMQIIRAGYGIASGPFVAGYLGSSTVMEYTAIGDTVNTAARLCGVAGASQILIPRATHDVVAEVFACRAMAPVRLKGKEHLVEVFEVLGPIGGYPS